MQRKKFPFLVTPPHILPPVKPSMLRYWIFDWKIFGKNTFYKICSKHGPDAKKNYFVFSIIDGGGESKPQWWKFHHLFFFFYSAPSLSGVFQILSTERSKKSLPKVFHGNDHFNFKHFKTKSPRLHNCNSLDHQWRPETNKWFILTNVSILSLSCSEFPCWHPLITTPSLHPSPSTSSKQ